MGVIRTGWGSALSAALVVGLTASAVWLDRPPAPAPAGAAATAFSAERAMAHVERMATRPRPAGSAQHDLVRDDLVAALGTLGLPVERQVATVQQGTTAVRAARVENLMVRLTGTASTGAVLLAAHYDSVPAGPGAADDGSGVATLLEATRAITAGPALPNDLIVLLTDAEEFGLLGAQAFVEQHPWAKDVRMVLDFEARGTSGPSQMFETSAGNGAVVAEWASLVPRPSGSSLTYEVYKRLPNDTDFSMFKKLGTAGLNFAFVGNWERYHTPRDSPGNLDRGSLQHEGDAAVVLARRFGAMDLAALQSRDAVYFSLPLVGVAPHYSTLLALPLAVVAAGLFALAFVIARRRRETSIGGTVLAVIVYAAFVAAAGLLGWRSGRLAGLLHARWLPEGNVLMSGWYAATLVGTIATVWLALYALLRKKFDAHSIAFAALAVFVIGTLATSWFVVGASFVLLWPLVGGVLAAMALRAGWDVPAGAGPVRACVISLAAAPAVLIVWPLVYMLFDAMGLARESGAAIGALAALGLGALSIQTEVIAQGRRWWPAAIAAVVTIACLAVAVTETGYSSRDPRLVNLLYVVDTDARTAQWTGQTIPRGVPQDRPRAGWPDPWLRQYLGTAPRTGRPDALVQPWSSVHGTPGFLSADAPVVDLPAPQASLVSSTPNEGGRTVTLHAAPAREGDVLSVWVNGARAIDASVDGKRIAGQMPARAADDTAWSLDYFNAPASGTTITLTLVGVAPLTVAVVNRSAGLPAVPGRTFAPRPASVVPVQAGDQTVVRRSYVF